MKLTGYEHLLPVLLGADLNCYNVARAFHEEYGVISHAFGRYPIGVTMNTKIVSFHTVEQMDDPDTMVETLNTFAATHPENTLILMGCTDDYVGMIMEQKERLDERYITPYTTAEQFHELSFKESFYQYCDRFGIAYPKTVVVREESFAELDLNALPFEYPIIIKASSSVLYWKHPFDGMKKVYRAKTPADAAMICRQIFDSGYPDSLILQDTIPGSDSRMYVLTAYSDENAKVRMMCLGHVLLEEHTPKGLGNHCAILSEYNPALVAPFKAFLEEIGYKGYSNFDIKYDSRDGSFRAFEINLRQGRSNYYVTASGCNIARNIVRDRVDRAFEGSEECHIADEKIYWRYIPDSIVKARVDKDTAAEIGRRKKGKKAFSSMRYAFDLKGNLKRRLYIALHEFRHRKKFRTYYPTSEAKKAEAEG